MFQCSGSSANGLFAMFSGPSLLQRIKDAAPLNLLLFPAPCASAAPSQQPGVTALYLPPNGDPVFLMPATNSPKGAIIYFHGNGCDAAQMVMAGGQFRSFAQQLDCHLLMAEYPGYGVCLGSPSESSCLLSARAAFDFAHKTLQIPADRIMLFGTSIGGGVAVELAARLAAEGVRIRALMLQCTFTSVRRLAADLAIPAFLTYMVQDRFDNLARLPQCGEDVSVFLFHGQSDELIPATHSQQLLEACVARHKRLLLLPTATHAMFPSKWISEAVRFFKEDVPAPTSALPAALPEQVAELLLPHVPPTAEELARRLELQEKRALSNYNRVRWLESAMFRCADTWAQVASWFAGRR